MATRSETSNPPRRRRGLFGKIVRWFLFTVVSLWLAGALTLVALRWVDPPTTALQTERYIQAWMHHKPYEKNYRFIPIGQISPNFQHAVISAEDARFYLHHGFDWHAMQLAAEDDLDGARIRGGSTLTQQLVKNLFFGTSRSLLRKGAEASLVPVAELVLGKQRILELYLNVVEWGPGIYGADAASHTYFKTPAKNLSRLQSAELASTLPAPLTRRPGHVNHYTTVILRRMAQVGW